MRTSLFITSVYILYLSTIEALDNGLGLTPAMGWNSWNLYGCHINETIVKRMADSMVSSGLKDLGYVYINIDDCWQKSRDSLGRIVVDHDKFPSGMKALGDYIHSLDLKFGLYSSAGTMTCERRPGSLGYELIDAETYASWGVDFLKYDNCFNKFGLTRKNNIDRYTKMRDALNATGRPIYYAMCNWGQSASWEWAGAIANSYRTTGDIGDLFTGFSKKCPCENKNCWLINYFDIGASNCSITNILEKQVDIAHYSKPGAFNDMDMLEVGNGGMTHTEYKTHFSLWAALKSPLILGNDISNMHPEIAAILKNKDIIDINQDPLGKAVTLVDRSTDYSWKFLFLHGKKQIIGDVWVGPLANGDMIAILLNRDDKPHAMELDFRKHLKFTSDAPVVVKDLWTSKTYLAKNGSVVARSVPGHGVAVLRIIGVNKTDS